MLLQNKTAIIYGAGGSMGGAVARALANAGAKVFLTGRNRESVQKVADDIVSSGGLADVDVVDAFDEQAVESHMERVSQSNRIDICFNGVGVDVIQDIPLVKLGVDDFVRSITLTMQTHFLTSRAAGKVMMSQGSGVILSLTATPGGIGYPYTGGFAAACCALESFSRNLASELGIHGVRVVNIRSGGSPDSRIFKEAINAYPDIMNSVLAEMEKDTMLKKLPMMADIANTAVFLSSDMAAKITGVTIDVTSGTTSALNYRSKLIE